MLNSKSVYGQSYGDYECFRSRKLNNIFCLAKDYNTTRFKWFKKYSIPKLRFAPSLWNYGGEIIWTQRQENTGLRVSRRSVDLMRWCK